MGGNGEFVLNTSLYIDCAAALGAMSNRLFSCVICDAL